MKTIIVTGASRGIGYHTALKLANLGHRVIATARSLEKLDDLAKEASKGEVVPVQADLTSSDDIDKITQAINSGDKIEALINNAGLLLNKPFLETSKKDWQQTFEVNLFGVTELIRSLHAKMKEGSHILNISSMGGFQGSAKFPGLSAYSSSKGALSILTECLSEELKTEGIAVNCLCIGAVQTEMLNEAFPGYEAPVKPNEMGSYIADFALNGHRFFNGRILPVALNNPE